MRKVFLVFFLSLSFVLYPASKFQQINTILVVVEENENKKIVREETPVSDGIYDTLWGYDDYIFFDMKLTDGFKMLNDELNVAEFASIAKSSGADSILLIKVNYISTALDKDRIKLKIENFYYKLFSINKIDALASGKINLNIEEDISKSSKNTRLKKTGEDIIKRIFG